MLQRTLLCCGVLLSCAGVASAQNVKIEFVDGRVNLIAQNAPVRTILAEWARLGGTRIVNAERITGQGVTLELKGYSERQALDIVLRGVAGYMIAARQVPANGTSQFDRIMILPTSTAQPARPTQANATFTPPPQPVAGPVFTPPDDLADDAVEPDVEPDAVRRAQEQLQQRLQQAQQNLERAQGGRVVGQPVLPGATGGLNQTPPMVIGPSGERTFTMTPDGRIIQSNGTVVPVPDPAAPRVGPTARPSNPFGVLPGTSRPGEVTPVPQQPPPQRDEERQ